MAYGDPVSLDDIAALLARQTAVIEAMLSRIGANTTPVTDESQLRARGYWTVTGWEPLVVDLQAPPTPNEDEVWSISRVTVWGECAVNPPNAQTPVLGLFLIPLALPAETLADANNAARGWNPATRGVPLPAGVVANVTPLPSGIYAYSISLTQSTPIPVNPGETLRAVISCNPGTAQPGPGVTAGGIASWGELIVMGTRRKVR